jgi:hypothetical protein
MHFPFALPHPESGDRHRHCAETAALQIGTIRLRRRGGAAQRRLISPDYSGYCARMRGSCGKWPPSRQISRGKNGRIDGEIWCFSVADP